MSSHEDYITDCSVAGGEVSNLFRVPGFELQHVAVDAMHAGDLGTFQDAIGSLLSEEVSNKDVYRSNKVDMVGLNAMLGNYYRRHPHLTKVTPLSSQQLTSIDAVYPTLRAKAAQTRHLA